MTKSNLAYVFLAMVGAAVAASFITVKFAAPSKQEATTQSAASPALNNTAASSPATATPAVPAPEPVTTVAVTPIPGAASMPVSPDVIENPQNQPAPALPDMALPQASADPQADREAQKQAHEQAARLALADLKSMVIRREFNKAGDAARAAAQIYADTQSACEFPPLLVDCERELASQREAEAIRASMDQARAEADARTRHQRFIQYRDEGIAAFNDQKYQPAILALQNALKEEDDPDTQALLEQAVDKTIKPRLCVAEFSSTGDIGITDAGKSVSEMLLGAFSQDRFQLVERSRLDSILNERDLTIAGVVDNPKLLSVKKVKGVRYLVVGTISRLNTLAISARLVDAFTGEILQSCEMFANDAGSLQACLPEVAAILEMTDQEKTAYLLERRRRIEAAAAQADADARAAAQRQLEEQMAAERRERMKAARLEFARRQHERDAIVALGDIKALMSRGDWERAAMYSAQAVRDYADTRAARDLVGCQEQSAANIQALRQAQAKQSAEEQARLRREREDRHRRFIKYRDDGATALARKDIAQAITLFTAALKEEDSADVRSLLQQVQKQAELANQYQLAMTQAQAAAKAGQCKLAYDLYKQAYSLQPTPDAMAGMNAAAHKLQELHAAQQAYDLAIRQAVTAAKSENWNDALAAYQKADSILSTKDTQGGIALAARKIQEARSRDEANKTQKAYSLAIALAQAAAKTENWNDALAAYQKANAIASTKEAQNGIALATQKIQAAQQAAQQKAMADQQKASEEARKQKALADQQKAEEARKLQAEAARVKFRKTVQDSLSAGDAMMKQLKFAQAQRDYTDAQKLLTGAEAEVLPVDEHKKLLQETRDKLALAAKAAADASKPIVIPPVPPPTPVTPTPTPVKPPVVPTPVTPASAPAPVAPTPTPHPAVTPLPTLTHVTSAPVPVAPKTIVPPTPVVPPSPTPAPVGGPAIKPAIATPAGPSGPHGPTSRPTSRPAFGTHTPDSNSVK